MPILAFSLGQSKQEIEPGEMGVRDDGRTSPCVADRILRGEKMGRV